MRHPHFRPALTPDEQLFCLLWGLHLGDNLEVVEGEVRSVLAGVRSERAIPEAAVAEATDRGLIEFEDLPGGGVTVRLTDRGRYQLHYRAERVMGKKRWELERREGRWLLKGFDLDRAIDEMYGRRAG